MSPSSRKLMDDILTNLLELEVGGSDKNNDDNNSNILVAADVDEQPVRKRKPFQSVQQRFEQRLQLQQEQAADSKESLWIQCDFCGEMIYRAIFQGHIIQHEPINILHQLYYHELGEEKRQRERIEQFHRKQAAKEQRRQQRRLDKPAGSCTSSMASGSSSTSSSDDSSNSSINSRRPSMSPEYGEGDDEREEEGEENDGMATISSTQRSRKRRERAWEKRPGKKQLPVTKQRKPNNNKPPISKPASVRKRSTAQNKSSNPPKPRKRNRNAHPFAHRPRKRRNFVKTEPLAGIMAEWTTAAEPAVKWEPTMALEAGSGKQRIRMDRPLLEHLLCMKNLGPNYDQVFVDLRKQRIVIDRQGRVPNPAFQNADQPMEQQPQQLATTSSAPAPKRRRSTRGALAADFSGSDDMTLVCLL